MSFQTVYEAVIAQLEADTILSSYIDASCFIRGFKESLPIKKYMLIFEPGQEEEITSRQDNNKVLEMTYEIEIFCRLILAQSKVESTILGNDRYRGLLTFTDNVKAAIRQDMSFAYDTHGRSLSIENAAGSFDLDSSNRHLTVSIDGKTPTGYDAIFCGDTTLAGADVALNIQNSLRSLGLYDDDGYKQSTCTFNATTNQFTINSPHYGPMARVVVTAGSSDDASSILGFNNPTEYRGTNIIRTQIETVTVENQYFPVRFRIIPLLITEEVFIGG